MRLVRAPRQQFDLVVIGMGSAGTLAVELAARDLGLRVAAVERARIGGDCLWTGCVPSKALLASARVAQTVRDAAAFGVDAGGEPRVDLEAVWRRIATVQAEIAATDDSPDRFRAMGAELVIGEARVTGPREVTVDTADGDRVLDTRFVLVCTGSRAAVPPIAGIDSVPVLTSDHLFELERPPGSVVVLGGGPIAVELGQGLQRLGVATTLVEREHRLLPREEPELAERLAIVLRREGVGLRLGVAAERISNTGDGAAGGVAVELADGTVERAARLLVATGRVANVDGLGLDALGLEVGPDGVHVDGRSRTHVSTIYAVGDAAAGRPQFTHTAAYDAATAVRDMFFPGRGLAPALVPWCTFSDPELARVGLTADEARAVHGERAVTVHRHELHHVDRARADGATDGLLIVVAVRRRIVGAHLLAPGAGELVHELALAMKAGIGLDELARLVHVYPTIATGVGRIAGDHAIGRARKLRAIAKLGRWLG